MTFVAIAAVIIAVLAVPVVIVLVRRRSDVLPGLSDPSGSLYEKPRVLRLHVPGGQGAELGRESEVAVRSDPFDSPDAQRQ